LHAAANGIAVDHVESFLEEDLDVQGLLGEPLSPTSTFSSL